MLNCIADQCVTITCIYCRKIVKEMINAPDADGMTPLHLAVKKEAFSRVETLLSYGAGKLNNIISA